MGPKRAQSESAADTRNRRPAPPYVPGVSHSVQDMDNTAPPNTSARRAELAQLVRDEQYRRSERARRNL
eukprot:5059129-Amphidinium_carterae.1